MGKGDKKSRRGKITIGSYGKTRPRKKSKGPAAIAAAPKKEKAPPKAKAKPAAAEAEAPAKKPAAKKAAKKTEE